MFTQNRYHILFKKIKAGAKVAIFGTLHEADRIKHELEKIRKDVELVCFLDSYKTGVFEGLPIVSPLEITKNNKSFDTVIISSFKTQNPMHAILKSLGIEDKNIFAVDPKDNTLTMVPRFDEEQVKSYLKRAKETRKVFKKSADRKLFQMILDVCLKNKSLDKLKDHAKKHYYSRPFERADKEYFEYINQNAIKTMIDGGAYDCRNSLLFAFNLPNIEKIWAFEPLYEKFKSPVYDNLVKNNSKIEIVKKALWDENTTLEFKEKLDGSTITLANKPELIKQECKLTKIDTITIDDFVEKMGAGKIDYIKMDIENAEMHALKGGEKTILKHRPQLAVCIYHSIEHFLEIPIYLRELLENYTFRLSHFTQGITGTIIYAIPKELWN